MSDPTAAHPGGDANSATPPGQGQDAPSALDGADLTATPSRPMELTVAVMGLLVSGLIVFAAQTMELRSGSPATLGPRWWPTLLGLLGLALSAILLLSALLRRPADRGETLSRTPEGLRRVILTLLSVAGYVVLWQLVGYAPATVLFLLAVLWISGARGWRALVLYPLLMTGFIVLLFSTGLRVPL